MTVKVGPRLRIAVLNWVLDDNEPLAGDLIEECEHRSPDGVRERALHRGRSVVLSDAIRADHERTVGGSPCYAAISPKPHTRPCGALPSHLTV